MWNGAIIVIIALLHSSQILDRAQRVDEKASKKGGKREVNMIRFHKIQPLAGNCMLLLMFICRKWI